MTFSLGRMALDTYWPTQTILIIDTLCSESVATGHPSDTGLRWSCN